MNIVYLCYGQIEVCEQALFSVISLLSKSKSNSFSKVLIYTDHPAVFENYFSESDKVKIINHSKEEFLKWRGEINFSLRVKLEILIDAFEKYSGSIVFVDADTHYLSDPAPLWSFIDENNSLMHLRENMLSEGKDPLTKKICKFAQKNKFEISGVMIPLSESTIMWNSGVIGVSASNKNLFLDALKLTDKMYKIYPKHIMEQLALSILLTWKTKVHASDHVIYHYWNQKPEYQTAIQNFLNKNSNLQSALDCYDNFTFPNPPLAPRKSFLRRLFAF